jgi:hypothetical protein
MRAGPAIVTLCVLAGCSTEPQAGIPNGTYSGDCQCVLSLGKVDGSVKKRVKKDRITVVFEDGLPLEEGTHPSVGRKEEFSVHVFRCESTTTSVDVAENTAVVQTDLKVMFNDGMGTKYEMTGTGSDSYILDADGVLQNESSLNASHTDQDGTVSFGFQCDAELVAISD